MGLQINRIVRIAGAGEEERILSRPEDEEGGDFLAQALALAVLAERWRSEPSKNIAEAARSSEPRRLRINDYRTSVGCLTLRAVYHSRGDFLRQTARALRLGEVT